MQVSNTSATSEFLTNSFDRYHCIRLVIPFFNITLTYLFLTGNLCVFDLSEEINREQSIDKVFGFLLHDSTKKPGIYLKDKDRSPIVLEPKKKCLAMRNYISSVRSYYKR